MSFLIKSVFFKSKMSFLKSKMSFFVPNARKLHIIYIMLYYIDWTLKTQILTWNEKKSKKLSGFNAIHPFFSFNILNFAISFDFDSQNNSIIFQINKKKKLKMFISWRDLIAIHLLLCE